MNEVIKNHNTENKKYTKSHQKPGNFRKSKEIRRTAGKKTKPIWYRHVQRQHLSVWHRFYSIVNLNFMAVTAAMLILVFSIVPSNVFNSKAFTLLWCYGTRNFVLNGADHNSVFNRILRFSSFAFVSAWKVPAYFTVSSLGCVDLGTTNQRSP